jgi:hypothetical protein
MPLAVNPILTLLNKGELMKKVFALLAMALSFGLAQASHAGLKPTPNITAFVLDGYGNITSAGTTGCQFTPEGCTVTESGNFVSNLGSGTWSATLHIDWVHAVSNNQGGFCAPTTGTGVVDYGFNTALFISLAGQTCEIGATGLGVPHLLIAEYVVTGGTGALTGVTGSGVLSAADNGTGFVRIHSNGILQSFSGKALN